MDFSKASKKFLFESAAAYSQFEKDKTPFAAVKICISGWVSDWEKLFDLLRNNFRSANDSFMKSKKSKIAVLMKNTTIEAAEEAVNRLEVKLRLLFSDFQKQDKEQRLNVSAYIYGVGATSQNLQFRYLEVIKTVHYKKESDNWPTSFKEYLRRLERFKVEKHKPISIRV